MAKRSNRRRRDRNAKTASATVASQANGGPTLFATMPGALMYRLPYPPGVPDMHTMRGAQLDVASRSAAFATLPDGERTALFESLTRTLRRSEYHRLRYSALRACLDERRADLPGRVFWDEFVETLHYELQAFRGAARMALDEIVYLGARRSGVDPMVARERPWETAKLITSDVPPQCAIVEVDVLRTKRTWFGLLNAYRNSFFHNGWTHGSGHFAEDDLRSAARDPAANALLVPDLSSLSKRSKPHERTFNTCTTVDDVMRDAHGGFDEVLRELCEGPWATPEPPPGRLPRNEHPNVIVQLIKPTLFEVHDKVLIAFFSTEAAAHSFGHPGPEGELLTVPVAKSVVGQRAVTFSLSGFKPAGRSVAKIDALFDPKPEKDWRNIVCTRRVEVDIAQALASPTAPLSIPVVEDFKRWFVWGPRNT
jgi:hypothetical protein